MNKDLREKTAVLVSDGGRYLSYEDAAEKILALCAEAAKEAYKAEKLKSTTHVNTDTERDRVLKAIDSALIGDKDE